MSIIVKLGQAHRPLPAFKDPRTGARYEYRCSCHDREFDTAWKIVRHVKEERGPCEM